MKKFGLSIKWKFSISFVTLSLGLVGIYVLLATKTFESDKIFYIFDSEQAQLESLSKQIHQKVERILFDSKSILASFDFNTKKLSPLGERLFNDEAELKAIEIWDADGKKELLKVEKTAGIIPVINVEKKFADEIVDIEQISKDVYLFTAVQKDAKGGQLWLRIVAELQDVLPKSATGHMILSQKDKIFMQEGQNQVAESAAKEIIGDLGKDRAEKTALKKISGHEYLVSTNSTKYGGMRLISIVDKEYALKALQTLFNRSLVFVLFSGFAVVIISLLLSSQLTINLKKLTEAAQKIGQGDFSTLVAVNSGDEVGVLSNAFGAMSTEIQRLLEETKDKARMEAELKTAKLVQESLFPKEPGRTSGNIELKGLFETSSECGGDWWYYYERGDYIYIAIADATGHGTPAALITSAARALFSQMEYLDIPLSEMARQWDRAVAACSNQKVLMTALLMKISKTTNEVVCVNASHELPFILRKEGEDLVVEPVMIPISSRLGQFREDPFQEFKFELNPGDRLFLFTDGLTSIESPEGKAISEKRLGKALEKIGNASETAADLVDKSLQFFKDHIKTAPLSDDLTLVAVKRN